MAYATCLDNPIQRLFARHLRVARVCGPLECESYPPDFYAYSDLSPEPLACLLPGGRAQYESDLDEFDLDRPQYLPYEVTVYSYTVLGLPYSALRKEACEGTTHCS